MSNQGIQATQVPRRRPVEAIEQRVQRSNDCERRVQKALTRLVKTGNAFTVEDVCTLARVGKTFLYDERRPELKAAVLAARDASQAGSPTRSTDKPQKDTASWRERAMNAEAFAKGLRTALKDRDAQISDLIGQLYDPEGNHLLEENSKLRGLIGELNKNMHQAMTENNQLRRSLNAARANVKRERERNVAQIFGGLSVD
ncbi:hypothetical protein [Mycobacterium sp.]|uniref:hypothetical protein n=1 Tax=Mycobacterium sp. TaxID=1785 RepID=UPI003D0DF6FB